MRAAGDDSVSLMAGLHLQRLYQVFSAQKINGLISALKQLSALKRGCVGAEGGFMMSPQCRYRTNAMEGWLQLIATTDLNGLYWLFTE